MRNITPPPDKPFQVNEWVTLLTGVPASNGSHQFLQGEKVQIAAVRDTNTTGVTAPLTSTNVLYKVQREAECVSWELSPKLPQPIRSDRIPHRSLKLDLSLRTDAPIPAAPGRVYHLSKAHAFRMRGNECTLEKGAAVQIASRPKSKINGAVITSNAPSVLIEGTYDFLILDRHVEKVIVTSDRYLNHVEIKQ